MAILDPEQIAVFAITDTVGNEIVSELVLLHPVVRFCTVRLYIVVTVGFTDGFEEVEVKPAGVLAQE